MSVSAKFKCISVIPTTGGDGTVESKQVSLVPVYSSDPTSPNYSWSKWTPSGSMSLTITNPTAFDQFEIGKEFLLEFTEVPPT